MNTLGSTESTDADRRRAVYVSVEPTLWSTRAFRLASYFVRNARTIPEQGLRLGSLGGLALLGQLCAIGDRVAGTRVMHAALRGMSRDRLDYLGDEFYQCKLHSHVEPAGAARVRQLVTAGHRVILVSHALEQIVRPLAQSLGVTGYIANCLEFRADKATGRLLDPVLPPASLFGRGQNRGADAILSDIAVSRLVHSQPLDECVQPAYPPQQKSPRILAAFGRVPERLPQLSMRQTYAGKHILLMGATGFIGKVWLAMLLENLPEISKIYLLIRRSGSRPALGRFEKLIAESPVFDGLHKKHGEKLGEYLANRVEVVEGDVSLRQFGLDDAVAHRLEQTLDLVVNSSGQTDFNPDLRDAFATNTDASFHILDFLRRCAHAALMHISTCFVSGRQDGRVPEELRVNQSPKGRPEFNAEHEDAFIRTMIERFTKQSESEAVTEKLRRQILTKHPQTPAEQNGHAAANGQVNGHPKVHVHPHSHRIVLDEKGIQHRLRKLRTRWLRDQLIDFGVRQAAHWGWPNIYTYTKALGEQLLHKHGGDLPIAMVRPSIVESALRQPFTGWNEGVNGTAPITWLVDTNVRQLPANPRQRLDVIPVDLVCRGMTLIGAALMTRCHEPVYQLGTSGVNPAEVERHLELACLAHRRHYWHTPGSERSQRVRSDSVPVSMRRFERTSLPMFRRWLERVEQLMKRFGIETDGVARRQKLIMRAEKVLELYGPFIHDNEFCFAADNISVLSELLIEDERAQFGYDVEAVDWREYWIKLHVPALRKWLYPVMEGRQPDTGIPPRTFKLPRKTKFILPPQAQPEPVPSGA